MRRTLAVLGVLILLLGTYAVLDAYDKVPGILTMAPPPVRATTAPTSPAPSVALPSPATGGPLKAAGATGPLPASARLAARLDPVLTDPALAAGVGVVVRDGTTGEVLFTHDPATPRTPASSLKLVSALAVTETLDMSRTMTTRVVRGASHGEIILVAGGDTLLARGAGNPLATVGHAGLGDLARQVATALTAEGTPSVRLRLDLSYAAGPAYPATWDRRDLENGLTQTVRMIGLADDRPDPVLGRVAPADPPASVATAFVRALAADSVTATLEPRSGWDVAAPAGAATLGSVESAPYADVLADCLVDSDDALMENLARQASVAAGGTASAADVVALVERVLTRFAIPTTGSVILDASGLTHGQRVTPTLVSDVLLVGSTGRSPAFAAALAALPVAGLTGTLAADQERFVTAATHLVAGVPRAKTGTLIGTAALAGTTVDADGRLLDFVIDADHVPATPGGTSGARGALDHFATVLTQCGCS